MVQADPAPQAPAYSENFTSGHAWVPAGAIKARVETVEGKKALPLSGLQTGGWNYASSATFRIQPGQKCVVRARVRVDRVWPAYAPYIKLEYVAITPDGKLDSAG